MVEGCWFRRKDRAHDAELVAYAVFHDHPRDVALAYVDTPGTESFQATAILFLRRVDRVHIDVYSVLVHLRIGGGSQQDCGYCGVTRFRITFGRTHVTSRVLARESEA